MLNVVIADDNIYYVKNLINFVIGKNSSIKINNIASNGLEVLDIVEKNKNIDLILLDLKMPKLDGLETLNRLSTMNLDKCPSVIVISGENNLIDKLRNNPLVVDFVNKTDSVIDLYFKLENFEKTSNYLNKNKDLLKKISDELIYIGYNPSHIGTQYIKECILEIYESKDIDLTRNIESCFYKKIACTHNKSFNNIKANIIKATNFMYAEADMNLLQDYFHFNDNKRKPTPKMVISTILNKL